MPQYSTIFSGLIQEAKKFAYANFLAKPAEDVKSRYIFVEPLHIFSAIVTSSQNGVSYLVVCGDDFSLPSSECVEIPNNVRFRLSSSADEVINRAQEIAKSDYRSEIGVRDFCTAWSKSSADSLIHGVQMLFYSEYMIKMLQIAHSYAGAEEVSPIHVILAMAKSGISFYPLLFSHARFKSEEFSKDMLEQCEVSAATGTAPNGAGLRISAEVLVLLQDAGKLIHQDVKIRIVPPELFLLAFMQNSDYSESVKSYGATAHSVEKSIGGLYAYLFRRYNLILEQYAQYKANLSNELSVRAQTAQDFVNKAFNYFYALPAEILVAHLSSFLESLSYGFSALSQSFVNIAVDTEMAVRSTRKKKDRQSAAQSAAKIRAEAEGLNNLAAACMNEHCDLITGVEWSKKIAPRVVTYALFIEIDRIINVANGVELSEFVNALFEGMSVFLEQCYKDSGKGLTAKVDTGASDAFCTALIDATELLSAEAFKRLCYFLQSESLTTLTILYDMLMTIAATALANEVSTIMFGGDKYPAEDVRIFGSTFSRLIGNLKHGLMEGDVEVEELPSKTRDGRPIVQEKRILSFWEKRFESEVVPKESESSFEYDPSIDTLIDMQYMLCTNPGGGGIYWNVICETVKDFSNPVYQRSRDSGVGSRLRRSSSGDFSHLVQGKGSGYPLKKSSSGVFSPAQVDARLTSPEKKAEPPKKDDVSSEQRLAESSKAKHGRRPSFGSFWRKKNGLRAEQRSYSVADVSEAALGKLPDETEEGESVSRTMTRSSSDADIKERTHIVVSPSTLNVCHQIVDLRCPKCEEVFSPVIYSDTSVKRRRAPAQIRVTVDEKGEVQFSENVPPLHDSSHHPVILINPNQAEQGRGQIAESIKAIGYSCVVRWLKEKGTDFGGAELAPAMKPLLICVEKATLKEVEGADDSFQAGERPGSPCPRY